MADLGDGEEENDTPGAGLPGRACRVYRPARLGRRTICDRTCLITVSFEASVFGY